MSSRSKYILRWILFGLCLLLTAACTAETASPSAAPILTSPLPAPETSTPSATAAPDQAPTETLPATDTPQPATLIPATNPPETAPAASSWKGIPVIPDASEPIEDENTYSYTTATGVAEAADFYQKEMAALGWELISSEKGEEVSQTLVFGNGSQNATIAVAQHPVEAGHTLVVIVLQ